MKMKKKPKPRDDFVPGIYDQKIIDWDELDEFASDPDNWKRHPQRQKQGLSASIKANGYAKPLIFNSHLGKFLDGHGRKEVAIREKHKNIPVALGRWTEEQHRQLLQQLDPLGAMYETDEAALHSLNEAVKKDQAKLKELGSSLEKKHKQAIAQMQKDMEHFVESLEQGAPKTLLGRGKRAQIRDRKQEKERREEPEEPSIVSEEYEDDVIFPSHHSLGFPELKRDLFVSPANFDWDRICTYDRSEESRTDHALYCYSSLPEKKKPSGGILGFYTDDWRFDHVYHSPADYIQVLRDGDWGAVIEPDFSTYHDYPLVMRQWAVYRSRWCCRYWQEIGTRIIPTIRRSKPGEPWLLEGLHGAQVVSTQCRMVDKDDKDFWKTFGRSITEAYKLLRFEVCLIYGGLSLRKYIHGLLPRGPRYVYLNPFISQRRKRMK